MSISNIAHRERAASPRIINVCYGARLRLSPSTSHPAKTLALFLSVPHPSRRPLRPCITFEYHSARHISLPAKAEK